MKNLRNPFEEYKPKYKLSKKTEYELLHNFVEQDSIWKEIYYVYGLFNFCQGLKRTVYKFAMRNNLK